MLGVKESRATKRGDMKVPTFYSTSVDINGVAFIFVMSVVGSVFGGIHCAGWFFNFPSSDEATLWRVSSGILTTIAFLLPVLFYVFFVVLLSLLESFLLPGTVIIVLAFILYVVSRLLLLLEAIISLRHITPGMLALVKWTSFIPHI